MSSFGHPGKGLTVLLSLRSAGEASLIFELQAKEQDTNRNAWSGMILILMDIPNEGSRYPEWTGCATC